MTADAATPSTPTEQQVTDYLREHPDFLADHPDLLDDIRIPHQTGGASLIEHQVSVLQDKNRQLLQQQQQYHQVANENEQLLRRIHDLHLNLLECDPLNQFVDTLVDRLESSFTCHRVVLLSSNADIAGVGHLDQAGADLFNLQQPICGRMSRERMNYLFADAVDDIQSVAVAQFVGAQQKGLLALASLDEHQFHPGMGTLFLELLSQLVCHRLELLDVDEAASVSEQTVDAARQ